MKLAAGIRPVKEIGNRGDKVPVPTTSVQLSQLLTLALLAEVDSKDRLTLTLKMIIMDMVDQDGKICMPPGSI